MLDFARVHRDQNAGRIPGQLVRPLARKKKKRNPLILDKIRHLELTYTLYKYQKDYNSLIDN